MSTVQNIIKAAGLDAGLNGPAASTKWRPAVFLGLGTSGCQLAAMLPPRPELKKLGIDTNPHTAVDVCGDERLAESEFMLLNLDTPSVLAAVAERTEGWREHASAIKSCTGESRASGAGRQQILAAVAASIRRGALVITIQNMPLAAAEMSDGQAIDVFIAKHAAGGSGLGMGVLLASCVADAARMARLTVRIIGLTLIEHTPDATAHDTAGPAQWGHFASIACAAAEVTDFLSVPRASDKDRSHRSSAPKPFEEIILDRAASNRLMTRDQLMALAVDTVISRIGPGRVLEGDFRNKRAQQEHQFLSELGPRIFSTRTAATLLFSSPKHRVVGLGAKRLLDRLMEPSPELDGKGVAARVDALNKMLTTPTPELRAAKRLFQNTGIGR